MYVKMNSGKQRLLPCLYFWCYLFHFLRDLAEDVNGIRLNGFSNNENQHGVYNQAFVGSQQHVNGHDLSVPTTDLDDSLEVANGKEINGNKAGSQVDTGAGSNTDEFRSLVPFCVVFGIGAMVSQSVTVYLSSQITVLEKAFGLSSTKSGLLLSANDVGFVATVLFASHFLKK